jgi:hypothetical protein
MSNRITDAEAEEAKRVLYRHYREWVADTANNLVEDYIRGEIEDEAGLEERLDSDTDSAMTYTKDQWDVLYSSEATSQAEEELQDMGGGVENHIAGLAYYTFRIDVRELLGVSEAMTGLEENVDPNDGTEARLEYILENYGKLFYRRGGTTAYVIEPIGDGLTQLDLGVLIQKNGQNSFQSLATIRGGKYHPGLSVALDALEEGRSTFIEAE